MGLGGLRAAGEAAPLPAGAKLTTRWRQRGDDLTNFGPSAVPLLGLAPGGGGVAAREMPLLLGGAGREGVRGWKEEGAREGKGT